MQKDKFYFDQTGFPLLWVDDIKSYVYFFPITKIQFETFICQVPDQRFGNPWYSEITKLNKRISPHLLTKDNYWQLFITGIKPDEVHSYQDWCNGFGNKYRVPTPKDWKELYQIAKEMEPIDLEEFAIKKDPKFYTAAKKIEEIVLGFCKHNNRAYTLADQMLMNFGVMEWVIIDPVKFRWGGMGEPHPRFYSIINSADIAIEAKSPLVDRLHSYGFRLFMS
jgi:hypothetical protein